MTIEELFKKYFVVEYGNFLLASGKTSHYYVDVKSANTNPEFLKFVTQELIKILKNYEFDSIAGVELGSVPLIVSLSIALNKPYIIIRKSDKSHGKKGMIGEPLHKKVIFIEDVVTSGRSALNGIIKLRTDRAEVNTVISIVDRQSGGLELLKENGVELKSLVKLNNFGVIVYD